MILVTGASGLTGSFVVAELVRRLYAQTWQFREDRLARTLGSLPRRSLAVTLRDTVTPSPAPRSVPA